MAARIVCCPNCGSEMWSRQKRCSNCRGLTPEEDAIRVARAAFARDEINVAELERRIHQALRNPPKPSWSGIRLEFR